MRGEAGATQVAGKIGTGLKISNSVRRGLTHPDLVWLHLKRIDGIRSQGAAFHIFAKPVLQLLLREGQVAHLFGRQTVGDGAVAGNADAARFDMMAIENGFALRQMAVQAFHGNHRIVDMVDGGKFIGRRDFAGNRSVHRCTARAAWGRHISGYSVCRGRRV